MPATPKATTTEIAPGVIAHNLENGLIRVTVIPSHGATIFAIVDLESGIDVMYKAPWGVRNRGDAPISTNSMVAWFERFPGGWPVLFPSGNAPSMHRGVEHTYHGEASSVPWTCRAVEDGSSASLHLEVALSHSPFHLAREMRLEAGARRITIHETATNVGGQPFEYTWTHHPTFGAPFLSPACRIDTGARRLFTEETYDHPHIPLPAGSEWAWPKGTASDGAEVDLSLIPSSPRQFLGYLADFESGWYAITNTELGVGFALTWPTSLLPQAWMFQELAASNDWPWFGNAYLMAIEPSTVKPAFGLGEAVAAGKHRTLEPGESQALELNAVLYHATTGVRFVDPGGNVQLLE